MTTPAPETVFDQRYRLLQRVGSGGMAEVWAAEDLQLGRRVALKLLHRRFAEDPEFIQRFQREASSAAKLQHPNIVSVYDRGEWDGSYYIAMEFLEGPSLKDVVVHEGALDPVRAIDITVQILKAARFAHKNGVVHRDLKPQNVIVDHEGRVKVTDFGIARAGASDMTETGSIMGTAQYLSPEQAQGHAVSPASDLYSIGIILFELLTGRLPFEGDSAVTIALKQVSEMPPAPTSINPAVPGELEAIVFTAMAKDPAARFVDADAFIAALEGTRERIVAGLAAPGDGTVAFGAIAPPLPPPPTDASGEHAAVGDGEPPDGEEKKRKRWPWVVAAVAVLLIAGGVLAVVLTRTPQKPVPEVVGLSVEVADQQLTAAGFESRVVRANNDSPRGQVFGQDPPAGEQADEGSMVTIRVSEGPPQSDVPDVAGETEKEARKQLEAAGFRVTSEEESDEDVDEGKVIRTRPGAGQEVDEGSQVTVVVSSGPQQVSVPEVVGNTQDQAESTLRAAGFDITVREQESTDSDPGTVTDQSPDGGTNATFGAAITITVAKAPPEVDVPNVLGRSEDTAVRAISSRDLEANVREEPTDDPSQDGRVIDQDPAGGSVAPGSTVTLVVGVLQTDTTTTETTTTEDDTP